VPGGVYSALKKLAHLSVVKEAISLGFTRLRKDGWRPSQVFKIPQYNQDLARKHGAKIAEVGVFEFNEGALHLCRSLGYEEFGRLDRCTYWQGRHWADLRLRKVLQA
jgi:hypothetical protein